MADKILERLWEMGPNFISGTPHAQKLGMTFVAVDKGRAVMSLPYNKDLVGDTKTGVIHGGAVTTLLDQVSGLAALAGFETQHPKKQSLRKRIVTKRPSMSPSSELWPIKEMKMILLQPRNLALWPLARA